MRHATLALVNVELEQAVLDKLPELIATQQTINVNALQVWLLAVMQMKLAYLVPASAEIAFLNSVSSLSTFFAFLEQSWHRCPK